MNSKSKYTPTKTGYKEEEELKKTVATKAEEKEIEELVESKTPKVPVEEDMSVPYPDLGGHTVSQLAGMEEHKIKSILGPKYPEFAKKYHL